MQLAWLVGITWEELGAVCGRWKRQVWNHTRDICEQKKFFIHIKFFWRKWEISSWKSATENIYGTFPCCKTFERICSTSITKINGCVKWVFEAWFIWWVWLELPVKRCRLQQSIWKTPRLKFIIKSHTETWRLHNNLSMHTMSHTSTWCKGWYGSIITWPITKNPQMRTAYLFAIFFAGDSTNSFIFWSNDIPKISRLFYRENESSLCDKILNIAIILSSN